ncbi:flagellar biosynthesis protein FlgN [Sulfitobacter sp. G21635-S1]|uniref:flagellar biosynthesis protein FlgN n=1 Tax=Sulfitobacter sp. G21635-S1 TaxID=3014043 RepID=UPI0022AE6D93|nr:flagellar biosynthesis protein FlgN [Sulfitobacter sp. G21635-S1]MCZ4257970.1 flagellar biosynthesis protein FlgN [Sulfitobacter sp. G21635-S1]
MTDETVKHQIDALNDLLDSERDALLKGDLERLAEMLAPKDTLIGAINSVPQDDLQGLRELDNKVKRNQLLLGGALDGIRAVADRMAQLRQVRSSLDTYSADGKKRSIDLRDKTTLERRA